MKLAVSMWRSRPRLCGMDVAGFINYAAALPVQGVSLTLLKDMDKETSRQMNHQKHGLQVACAIGSNFVNTDPALGRRKRRSARTLPSA